MGALYKQMCATGADVPLSQGTRSLPRHIVVAASVLLAAGCSSPPPPQTEPGAPLVGLSSAELDRFQEGEALFNHVFTQEQGLGPLFNENQCSACHTDPVSGGTGEQVLIKATRFVEADGCDPLSGEGGENIRQRATPLLQAHGIHRQTMPPSATERARITVPFLFGLGLVEAIPEKTILARADPDDADGDGISGRAGRDGAGRLARFSRKAEVATLRGFIDTALRFEMGLTTPDNPHEAIIGGVSFPPGADPVSEPEIDPATLERLIDYVRFLAPLSRRTPVDEEEGEMVERGEALFREIGCASCHVPAMKTGRSEIPALDRQTVHLYSDLLLHDMGPDLADVCGVSAAPSEIRTEMLMGLGHRRVFLHDGRARSVYDAILMHGGEASRARAAFQGLGRVTQEDLLRFLRKL